MHTRGGPHAEASVEQPRHMRSRTSAACGRPEPFQARRSARGVPQGAALRPLLATRSGSRQSISLLGSPRAVTARGRAAPGGEIYLGSPPHLGAPQRLHAPARAAVTHAGRRHGALAVHHGLGRLAVAALPEVGVQLPRLRGSLSSRAQPPTVSCRDLRCALVSCGSSACACRLRLLGH